MLLLGSMGMLASLWSDMLFPALTSIQQDLTITDFAGLPAGSFGRRPVRI